MRISAIRLLSLTPFLAATPVFAQFAPGPNPINTTVTTAQTLASGGGTVTDTGAIRIASGSTALSMFGTSTLDNHGTIQTLGTGRAIDSNNGIAFLELNNYGLISSASTDAFRVNTNSRVRLYNYGTIQVTNGGQAIDWAAISSAENLLENHGTISAVGEDAVRPGTNGLVLNFGGTIRATPVVSGSTVSGSDGIDLRTLSGITVMNYGLITGRHGIATDGSNAGPSTFTLGNEGTITAINGSGVNIDGVSASVTATITNSTSGVIQGGVLGGAVVDGDGDGIDVDGVIDLTNSGLVFGRGARGGTNNAEGVAAGGGSIHNYGSIIGSSLAADAPNGDTSRGGNGILFDDSNGGSAVASSFVGNTGLIEGRNGFAVRMIGNRDDTIVNDGTIHGTAGGAAIQMGDGNDFLSNSGAIVGDTGTAIDLEAGNDYFQITGNHASITGNVSGGSGSNSMLIALDDGASFNYAGVLSNFNDFELANGRVTLSGANQLTGETKLSGGTLVLDGTNRLGSLTGLAIGDATLALENTTGANAQAFASLTLLGNATLDLGYSSLTFDAFQGMDDGSSLTIINWAKANSPDYAIRFLGDYSTSAQFLAFINGTTINGAAAAAWFDGTYTNVAAVPLPAAAWMLLSGLGAIGAARRRRLTPGFR